MRIYLQDGTIVDAGVDEWVILELSDRDKLNVMKMAVGNAFFATFPEGMKNGAMQDILEEAIQTASLRDKGIIITKGKPASNEGDADEDELDENDTPNPDSDDKPTEQGIDPEEGFKGGLPVPDSD